MSFSVKPSAPVGPVKFSDIQKTSVVIAWKPSENDGGSPITGYYIEMREAPKSSWQRVTTVNADITSYCVQNLKENKDFYFRIYAENTVGRSDALASDAVTIKSPFGKFYHLEQLVQPCHNRPVSRRPVFGICNAYAIKLMCLTTYTI